LAQFFPKSISTNEDKYTPIPSPELYGKILFPSGTACDSASDFLWSWSQGRSQIL